MGGLAETHIFGGSLLSSGGLGWGVGGGSLAVLWSLHRRSAELVIAALTVTEVVKHSDVTFVTGGVVKMFP